MNKESSVLRLFWAALLAAGLFVAGGTDQVAAQETGQPQVSEAPAEPTSPSAGTSSSGGPPPLPATPERTVPPPLPTFYIAEGGQPVGPLNVGELQQRVTAGTLTAATLVWRDGMEDWRPAREVEELALLFASPGSDIVEEEAPEFDARNFLTGSWRSQGQIPIEGVGPSDAELTADYRADGTVSVDGTINANLGQPTPTVITIRSVGTWTVENIDEESFSLTATLTTTGTAPGIDLSEMEETETTTGVVSVLGPDMVRDDEGLIWNRLAR